MRIAPQALEENAIGISAGRFVWGIRFLPHHFGRTMFFSRAITEPLVSAVPMRERADDGSEAERWL